MELDSRGVRFGAGLTSLMLVIVLATGSGWLALTQAIVFASTALTPQHGPYSYVYRALVLPRLDPIAEGEPAAPARFAQTLGFTFVAVSAAGYLTGVATLGVVFAAFGLLASFLNAAFGFCIGCQIFLALRRLAA